MSDLFLSTLAENQEVPVAKPPMPSSPGSLCLIGLLALQDGLDEARKALNARAAYADADETRHIRIQMGLIQSDYVKIDAMITAYLSSSTITMAIDQNALVKIRGIVEQLQGLNAQRERVTDIVNLVTRLLNGWKSPTRPGTVTEADLAAHLN